jgi:uncharacterized protein (DUF58 family)
VSTTIHAQLSDLLRLRFETHRFSLLPRQPVHSLLSGQHASRLRGRGLSFEELRRYQQGDDIRLIDWKATARKRKAHVRVYSEERDRPVLLVVDQRATMFFGSQRTTKATTAAEVAALAAWRAIQVGDRVGAVIFGDTESVEIKPQRSRRTVLRICHELVRMNQQLSADSVPAQNTGLNSALERAVNLARHDYLVVLATDYHGHDDRTQQLATRLAAHNDVLAILIYDPLGIRMPVSGQMAVSDGQHVVDVPTESGFEQRFEDAFRTHSMQIRNRLKAVRIPVLPICTHESVPRQIVDALGQSR